MVFHWSLSDSKSPQVSRTLPRILAVLNSAVVWTVSTRPSTSKSSIPFGNPLVTVPNAPNYYYYYYLLIRDFHISVSWWYFTEVWVTASLLKSPGPFSVFFNNAVVCMVSTRSPTSKFSRPFSNPSVTVPKAPITTGIIVTFMFHSFFNSLARSRY